MATILERLRKIIVEQLAVKPEDVVLGASFVEDLNTDSLDLVELIMAIEEEFTRRPELIIEISDEDAEKISTVQDAVDWLRDHGIKDEEDEESQAASTS